MRPGRLCSGRISLFDIEVDAMSIEALSASAVIPLNGNYSAHGADVPRGRQHLPEQGKSLPEEASLEEVSRQQVEEAVDQIKEQVQLVRRGLQFSVDDDSGKTIVRVIDSDSGDLIRQIPSEEFVAISQAIAHNLERLQGVLLKDEA